MHEPLHEGNERICLPAWGYFSAGSSRTIVMMMMMMRLN